MNDEHEDMGFGIGAAWQAELQRTQLQYEMRMREQRPTDYAEGESVEVTQRIWEPADDHSPGGLLAQPGEHLVVRKVSAVVTVEGDEMGISVSHHGRTDGMTFWVRPSEIRRRA